MMSACSCKTSVLFSCSTSSSSLMMVSCLVPWWKKWKSCGELDEQGDWWLMWSGWRLPFRWRLGECGRCMGNSTSTIIKPHSMIQFLDFNTWYFSSVPCKNLSILNRWFNFYHYFLFKCDAITNCIKIGIKILFKGTPITWIIAFSKLMKTYCYQNITDLYIIKLNIK